MTNCPNCTKPIPVVDAKYCAYCGAKTKVSKLTVQTLLQDAVTKLMSWDNAFWTTFKTLWRQPQQVIKGYLEGQRKKYLHPISYLGIVLVTLSVLLLLSKDVDFYSGFFDGWAAYEGSDGDTKHDISPYYTFITFLLIPLFSLVSKLLYRKQSLNYAEHLLMNTYWYSQFMSSVFLMTGISLLLNAYLSVPDSLMTAFIFLILFSQTAFFYHNIFPTHWLKSGVKVFLFFISSLFALGMVLMTIAIIVWGM